MNLKNAQLDVDNWINASNSDDSEVMQQAFASGLSKRRTRNDNY